MKLYGQRLETVMARATRIYSWNGTAWVQQWHGGAADENGNGLISPQSYWHQQVEWRVMSQRRQRFFCGSTVARCPYNDGAGVQATTVPLLLPPTPMAPRLSSPTTRTTAAAFAVTTDGSECRHRSLTLTPSKTSAHPVLMTPMLFRTQLVMTLHQQLHCCWHSTNLRLGCHKRRWQS